MDVFRTLVTDHVRMRALFNEFASSPKRDMDCARLCIHLGAELEQHVQGEEAHLYPALRRHAETKALVEDAVAAHAEMKKAMADVEACLPDRRRFREKLAHLEWVMMAHFQKEETEVFPAAERTFSPAEATALAEKIQAMRPVEPRSTTPTPGRPAGKL